MPCACVEGTPLKLAEVLLENHHRCPFWLFWPQNGWVSLAYLVVSSSTRQTHLFAPKAHPCAAFNQAFSGQVANWRVGLEVVVLQGERPLAKDNKKLGMFRLDGIPPAPKGELNSLPRGRLMIWGSCGTWGGGRGCPATLEGVFDVSRSWPFRFN